MKVRAAFEDFLTELRIKYGSGRTRPENHFYYMAKLTEEAGEVAEALIAVHGSKKKQKKIEKKGSTPIKELTLELGDVVNVVFLLADHHCIAPADVMRAAADKLKEKRLNA